MVFAGGALGTLARVGISQLWLDPSFPWATFFVNLLGSFGLGILAGSLVRREDVLLRGFVGAGLLGSLTTFSTFAVEVVAVADSSGLASGLAYAGLSVGIGLSLAVTGYRIGYR